MVRASKRVCVLVSGGVDSSVLVADLLRRGHEVHPLYFRGGYAWERAELHWLKRLMRRLAAPDLKPLSVLDAPQAALLPRRHWSRAGRGVPLAGSPWESVHLPGRNLILLSHAAVFSALRRIPRVAQAVLHGNPFADASPAFRVRLEAAAATALGRRVSFEAPYRGLTKEQVARRVPGFPLELTFSCLRPRGLRHCGVCAKCEERTWAFPARTAR